MRNQNAHDAGRGYRIPRFITSPSYQLYHPTLPNAPTPHSNTHLHRNTPMWLIPPNLKIPHLPAINLPAPLPPNRQLRKRPRRPPQLHLQRLHMIHIHMRVPHRMRKRPRLKITHVRQHVRQQRVAGDVERHAEAHVAAALVELAVQSAPRFFPRHCRRPGIRDVELREHVTGRESHDFQIRGVPGAQNNATIIGRIAQLPDHIRELINALSRIICFGIDVTRAEVPPLEAIHGPEIALGAVGEANAVEVGAAGVGVPDLDSGGGEGQRGGGAADEPEKFGEDGAEEDALCGEEGEDGSAGGGGEGEFEGGGGEEGEGAGAGAGGG